MRGVHTSEDSEVLKTRFFRNWKKVVIVYISLANATSFGSTFGHLFWTLEKHVPDVDCVSWQKSWDFRKLGVVDSAKFAYSRRFALVPCTVYLPVVIIVRIKNYLIHLLDSNRGCAFYMFRGFSRGFRDSVFGDSFSGGDSALGDSKTLRGFSSKGFRDSGFSRDSGFTKDSEGIQMGFRIQGFSLSSTSFWGFIWGFSRTFNENGVPRI